MAGDDWTIRSIDEIKANEASSIAIGPFGSRMKSDLYTSTGVPVIRGNNISDTKALTGDFVYVGEDTAEQLRSSNVFPNDLVFPHRGAIGRVGIVPDDGIPRYLLSTWEDRSLVFPNRVGKPMDHNNLYRRDFKKMLKKAELPDTFRFHDLRHTCATLLFSKNVNPKIVQEMLGHATITQTMDTYSHVLPTMQDAATEAMESALS